MKLGVNIDHVATIREARGIDEPSPLTAAAICEFAGCHLITAHLREDRRHINDEDIYDLRMHVKTELNLEMSCVQEIVNIALDVCPDKVTLVPEKREELTTEGGLDVCSDANRIAKIIESFKENDIEVGLFIDPDGKQIKTSKEIGADSIEIHTGTYANAKKNEIKAELLRISESARYASELGLIVNAGHGLNYHNVCPIAQIENIIELNIGHSIISRAVFVGLDQAVRDMLLLVNSKQVLSGL